MSTPLGPILSMWEAEGNRHAAEFDACAGAVVIGERPSVAAEVALGIARVQARRRRVAVADTVGELGPLEDLVPMDAPYGLIDSFFYGVSLNKIAYTVDPAKNLIIFPSGAAPIDHEALLSSDRWVKLLDGFRAADGLLLIVAPAESSALSALIEVMDGVVLVGNVAAAPGTRVLAHARLPIIPARPTPPSVQPVPPAPSRQPRALSPEPNTAPMPLLPPPPVAQIPTPPAPSRPSFHDAPGSGVRVEEHEEDDAYDSRERKGPEQVADRSTLEYRDVNDSRGERDAETALDADSRDGEHEEMHGDGTPAEGETELVPPWAREEEFTGPSMPPTGSAKAISFWVAIVFGAFIAAALLTWITTSMLSRNDGSDSFAVKPDSAHPAVHVLAAPAPTGLAAPAAPRDTAPVAATAAADSMDAPYSVVLADVSSMTGANGELDQASSKGFPVMSFSPYARADGGTSYVVISGAFSDSAGADSLLRAVRAKRYRTAAAAHVVRLPYAVLIQKGVSTDQASMFVRAYLSKGLPVYPLLQADGTASLWAGAFRTAEQAQPLVTSFRANGDQPTVTIRTGRSF
ncbi:MAG: SPOR domain-containing protein [Gemmatimonadota bacterium]|nr:SPOR domain-containing protein [Gemmatimonadota bacterium]